MKKLILSIALISGITLFCNANHYSTSSAIQNIPESSFIYVDDDGYAPVTLEELPEKVQEAITKNYAAYDVKSLAFHAEKKLTKVTLIAKADGSEEEVILDENGNVAN